MNRLRILATSALTVAALGGASACSSSAGTSTTGPSSPAPSITSTPSTTVATTTVPASPASSSAGGVTNAPVTTGATGGSGGSGPSACKESQLRANVTSDDIAGLDRHVVRATFTNKSGTTCTLTGFPGAAIEDSSNHQVKQATRTVGGPVGGTIEKPGTVTLRAGATAYAYLEGTSTREQGAAQAGCDGPKYPRILVTPPNTETPVPFTIGWPQCYSFSVHPVRKDT